MNAYSVAAPVVNSDSTSPEAILARKAKIVELQSHADSAYDDKSIQRDGFTTQTAEHHARNLLYGTIVSAGFLSLFVAIFRK